VDTLGTRHRIARWLRPLFELDANVRPERIVVQHVSVNDKYVDVATLPFATEATEERLAELAETIESAVNADAEGLGGLQRYVISAFRGVDQLTRLPVRLSGTELSADGEPLDSEPATTKGVLAQLMRHLEAQARMFTLGYGQVLSVMQRTIARQQGAVEAAEDVRLESVALAERMLSETHERDLATQNTQHEVDSREKMFHQLSDLLMLGASHVLTAKAGSSQQGAAAPSAPSPAAPPSAVDLLLKQLFQSLGPEQIEELRKVLTLEQFLLISRLVQVTSGADDEQDDTGGPGAEPSDTGAATAAAGTPRAGGDGQAASTAGAPAAAPAATTPPNTASPAAAPSSSGRTTDHRNTKKRRRS
jgi:hypothetical protein